MTATLLSLAIVQRKPGCMTKIYLAREEPDDTTDLKHTEY